MNENAEIQQASVVHVDSGDYDVYVGRRDGGKWGNPFLLGRDGNRADVIEKYRAWIKTQPELMAALPELVGKRLACHCHPQACHGDVLAEMANELALKQQQEVLAQEPPSLPGPDHAMSGPRAGQPETGLDPETPAVLAGGKVVVCGSRDWPAERVGEIRARLEQLPPGVTVIAGGARGVDKLAEGYAKELGLPVDVHLAHWEAEGRSAGYKRNLRMLDLKPDLVIAFQVGGSRGTQHTIDHAMKRGIEVDVFDELNYVEDLESGLSAPAPAELAPSVPEISEVQAGPVAEASQPSHASPAVDPVIEGDPGPEEGLLEAGFAPSAAASPVDDSAAFEREYATALDHIRLDIRRLQSRAEEAFTTYEASVDGTESVIYASEAELYAQLGDRFERGAAAAAKASKVSAISAALEADAAPEAPLSDARRGEAWELALSVARNVVNDHREQLTDGAPLESAETPAARENAIYQLQRLRDELSDGLQALYAPLEVRDLAPVWNRGPSSDWLYVPPAQREALIQELGGGAKGAGRAEIIARGVTLLRDLSVDGAGPERLVAAGGSAATLDQLAYISSLERSTGQEAGFVRTKAEAKEAIEHLKEVREKTVTVKQKDLLRSKCELQGVPYVEPATRSEWRERLAEVSEVSAGQEQLLRRLATQTGGTFVIPRDSLEASKQIDALKRQRGQARSAVIVSEAEIDAVGEDLRAEAQEKMLEDKQNHWDYSIDEDGNLLADDYVILTRDDIAAEAQRRRYNQITGDEGRAESIGLSSEAAATGVGGIGVPYQADEIAQPGDYNSDMAEERFNAMPSDQRRLYQDAVAEGRLSDFGGAAGSEAGWAYGGQEGGYVPGDPAEEWQLEQLMELSEKAGAEFQMPLDKAEASRMLGALRGPDKPASPEQLEMLDDLVQKLGRSKPEVSTSWEASQEISKLTRIEYAKNPWMSPKEGQLKYLEELGEKVDLKVHPPGSALRAERMIDQLKALRKEDPEQAAVTRDLLTSPAAEFEGALTSLRENEQAVLRARYRNALSVKEAATELRCSPHDIEVLEVIARDKFRRARGIQQPSSAPRSPGMGMPPAGA